MNVTGSILVRLATAALLVLVARPAFEQSIDASEVLAFEDARFSAMLRSDVAWLRDALAEDVSYVHTTGRSDTKAQYLDAVTNGSLRYEVLVPKYRHVHMIGPSAAVVAGLLHARALATDGTLLDSDVRYTAVYERVGDRWRLVAWQTTRVA
jgi:ketosteroid isomerase-like protein